MGTLDINKINKKAEELDKALTKEKLEKEKLKEETRLEKEKDNAREKAEGAKIRKALSDFHNWAMRNNIPVSGKSYKPHWWSFQNKWWILDQCESSVFLYGESVPTTNELIVLRNSKYKVAIKSYYNDCMIIEEKDNNYLAAFSFDRIEENIIKFVQENNIPFK